MIHIQLSSMGDLTYLKMNILTTTKKISYQLSTIHAIDIEKTKKGVIKKYWKCFLVFNFK